MAKSTVVIPNFNGIKYIGACLDSLYMGTIKDLEVVVVDNGSADGSMELVRDQYPQVRLIANKKNTGFCHAVNQGIQASTTPYVILLNNDTRVDLSFVHELEKVMDADTEKKIFSASAKLISLYEKDQTDDAGDFYCALGWAFARGKGKNPDRYRRDCEIFAACAGAAIYRRELLEEKRVGLFDEVHFAYLEDIDIGYRAKIHGYINWFAANSIVYHAGSATSGSRYNAFKTRIVARNSVYLIYKNMPAAQIILNFPLLFAGYLTKLMFFTRKRLGKEYLMGFMDGIRISMKISMEGKGKTYRKRQKKVSKMVYVKIQFGLWRNLFRLFEM